MAVRVPAWLWEIQVEPIRTWADGFGQVFMDSQGFLYRAPGFKERMGALVEPTGWAKLQNGAYKSSLPLERSAFEEMSATAEKVAGYVKARVEAAEKIATRGAGGIGIGIGLGAIVLAYAVLKK